MDNSYKMSVRHWRGHSPHEREYETLRAATWLIEREFDAPVSVVHADDAPADVARQAEPGRPAIDIDE